MAFGPRVHDIVKHCWSFNSRWAAEIRPTEGVSGIILLVVDPAMNSGGCFRRALATARQGLRWHSGRQRRFTRIGSWACYGGQFHEISFTKSSRQSTVLPCSSPKSERLQGSAQQRCNSPVLHRWWRPPSDAPLLMKPRPTCSLIPSLASSWVQLLLAATKCICTRSPSCSRVLGLRVEITTIKATIYRDFCTGSFSRKSNNDFIST
jgi:hypothetical protein